MKSVLSLFVSLVLIGCATTLPSQGDLKKLIIGNFSNVRGVLELVEIGKFNKEQKCWPVKAKVLVGHTFGRKTIQIANYWLRKSDDGAWAVSQSEEVKSGIVDERALKTWETDAREKEMVTEEVTGYYIVKKGESLSRIAEREDVFGDPLKWPILYWLNMDELDKLQLAEDPPDRKIPEGVRLKIVSPDEMRENLKNISDNVWAVNVLSSTSNGEIIAAANRLIRNGYPVYITRIKIRRKDWMRLRVGFFKNRTDADNEGKKIMTILNFPDFWITKVEKQELEEFGGYGTHRGQRSQQRSRF